jgi:dodecin
MFLATSLEKGAYTPFRPDVVMLACKGGRKGGREHPVRHTEREGTYDVIQLIGTSNESWEKAAAHAVEQASKSIRDVRVAEIVELDMQLDPKGKVEAYRAKVKLSFKYGAKS